MNAQRTRAAKQPPELRALLERIVGAEGGPTAADEAAGLPVSTFSRWTNRPDQLPATKSLKQLAQRLGSRYGFTERDILVMAGHLSSEGSVTAPAETAEEESPPEMRVAFAQARERLSPDEYQQLIELIRNQVPMVTELLRTGKLGPSKYRSPDQQERGT